MLLSQNKQSVMVERSSYELHLMIRANGLSKAVIIYCEAQLKTNGSCNAVSCWEGTPFPTNNRQAAIERTRPSAKALCEAALRRYDN